MSPLTLKRSSGFFAAGREIEQALALLSDGAFKLFVHVCLHADCRSGRLCFRHGDLARRLGKSPRSITSYLRELQLKHVCQVQAASNQHRMGSIEIADRFWPYHKQTAETTSNGRWCMNRLSAPALTPARGPDPSWRSRGRRHGREEIESS